MNIGEIIPARGFITQEKYLLGKSLDEIESILGFNQKRLSRGVIVATLLRLPNDGEYKLAGYTQVADHHTSGQYGKNLESKFDMKALTRTLREQVWSLNGSNRLVKVMPAMRHDDSMRDDDQYPPGKGVPQWKLISSIPASVVAVLNEYPGSKYYPSQK